MNRLRVRVELNRRKPGVPLNELVGVVEETRKFFELLSQDVEIETGRGQWLASDFDPESLNFTVEYDGPATPDQIRDFGAAFGGTTSVRQETIAQFTQIAGHIDEDELVGFGIYKSDQETQPSEWRCLSRRDAHRFASEIQFLAKAVGESVAPLPPIMSGDIAGRRLFKNPGEKERSVIDPSRKISEVESLLSRKISLLEQEIVLQGERIKSLAANAKTADQRALELFHASQSAWASVAKQLPAPATPDTSSEPANSPAKAITRKLAFQNIVIWLLIASVTMLSFLLVVLGTARL